MPHSGKHISHIHVRDHRISHMLSQNETISNKALLLWWWGHSVVVWTQWSSTLTPADAPYSLCSAANRLMQGSCHTGWHGICRAFGPPSVSSWDRSAPFWDMLRCTTCRSGTIVRKLAISHVFLQCNKMVNGARFCAIMLLWLPKG